MITKVWRISKQKYAATAFSGEGSRRVSGRWHSKGSSIVYTSATLSLAALETFVHIEIEDAGNMLVSISADLPEDLEIERLDLTQLPENWRATPAPKALALIGDEWFTSQRSAVLMVPSAIIPVEHNFLINPLHKEFSRIEISDPKPFIIDRRMWKDSSDIQ